MSQHDARELVSAVFAIRHEEDAESLRGSVLRLFDPEPWPDEVCGLELADELASLFVRHLAIRTEAADAIALWAIFAHAHEAFEISPLLVFASPEKRCGKTNALLLLQALVPRPLMTGNLTAAVVFRAIDEHRPTLLMDEGETYLGDNENLRGLLNIGHLRKASKALRCEGDSHEVRAYSVWCPKAIALIGRLAGTIEDRSVIVAMRRKGPGEAVERVRADRLDQHETLRRRANRWADDHLDALREADPGLPSGLHDRAQDNWRPLMAVADALGRDWPERARRSAVAMSGAAEPSSAGERLLHDLRALFDRDSLAHAFSEELVTGLTQMEGQPWAEWNRLRPLTKHQLAQLLRPYGITPRTLRRGDCTRKGYPREDFEDAWRRYLPPAVPSGPSQRHNAGLERQEATSQCVTEPNT